jgi:hypothetical protein
MSTNALARLAALLLAVAALSACGGSGPTAEAARTDVAVVVDPSSAALAPAGSVTFAATVTGTANTAVTWSVQESGGGTVDTTGRYVAPGAAGVYHVVARSTADATASASATVTIVAPVAVTISPRTATVAASGSVAFAATVASSADTAVSYAVQESSGCGSVTAAGVYTAPGAAATCHVIATSHADATKSDVATVTVTAPPPSVAISVTPSSKAINSCQSVTLAATVTGSSNTAVTWSVQEGSAGGTVTSAGVFTASATAGTYHVVATSAADPTKTAVATVTVTDKILSVAVAPTTVSLQPGASAQFTATVTTTCGTFASSGTLTAAADGTVVAN